MYEDEVQLGQSITQPRFAQIDLTPSKSSDLFNTDVTKVGVDLNDHIVAFQAILIQKHEIDKIKSDDKIVAAEFSIPNASKKIERGLQLIEFMLQERFWFMREMRSQDERQIAIIEELQKLAQVPVLDQENIDKIVQGINNLKAAITRSEEIFHRANQSLLALDKRFLHREDWRKIMGKDQTNMVLHEVLKKDLMGVSNLLYILFKKRQHELAAIQTDSLGQIIPPKNLDDAQIEQLIKFLETFSTQVTEIVPQQIEVLCHLWIEDLIKIQNMFQRNLRTFSAFLSSFTAKFDQTMLFIKKTQQNLIQLRNDNQNSLRLLKMIQLPVYSANQNLQYHTQAFQKLKKAQENIQKIRIELNQMYKNEIQIVFLRAIEQQDEDEEDKPIGQMPLSIKLEAYNKPLLSAVKFEEVCKLSAQLEYLAMDQDGLLRIVEKIKELWICEKKLRKGQRSYLACAEEFKKAKQAIDAVPDPSSLSEQALLDLAAIGDNILHNQRILQRHTNSLNYFNSSSKVLSATLPLIGDFIVQVEKFIFKSNLLQEQIIQGAILRYRVVFNLIAEKRKAGGFKKPAPQPPVQPPPQIDSDQEFEMKVQQQGFKSRVNNQKIDDNSLFIPLVKSNNQSILTRKETQIKSFQDPQLASLTDDLINNNKGNIKIENIHGQNTYENPISDG